MLGRVEAEDFLTLSRARVDGAEVLAALHLPDGRDLTVLLDGVVGYLFGRSLLGFGSAAASGSAAACGSAAAAGASPVVSSVRGCHGVLVL